MSNDHDADALRMPDDVAHRILARAIELDAVRASLTTETELRDVAQQAGISPHAFEEAMMEMRALLVPPATGGLVGRSAVPGDEGRPNLMTRLWWRLRGDEVLNDRAPRIPVWESVVTNVIAVAAFWVVLGLLARICRGMDVDWQVRKAADVVALVFGAGIAHRLRARLATFAFVGLGVAQGAEALMDVVSGVPVVQGAGAHFALIIAGLAGVTAGAVPLGGRRSGPGEAGQDLPAPESAPAADPRTDSADHARSFSLRLRAT